MGYRSRGVTPPVKDCTHRMTFTDDRCWCSECGQTWKMLRDRETDQNRGWFPLPLSEAIYGERTGRYR